tara:strand:+ start:384 stop:686 length:303 start_codon:yes stop_codon:yes gene_type:complete
MNIKSLLLGSTLAVTSLFTGVGEAQAQTCFTTPNGTGAICNTYRGNNGYGEQIYTVGYSDTYVSESMIVTCDGKRFVRYESQGSLSKLGAGRLARYFCSL